MLQIVEKPHYRSEIALPEKSRRGELLLVALGMFTSRGGFSYRQVAPLPVLHLVRSGSGVFENRHGVWRVGTGDVMGFWPGEAYFYYDDPEQPWEYYWCTFDGSEACAVLREAGFSPETPYRRDCSWRALPALEYWHAELAHHAAPTAAPAAAWDILHRLGNAEPPDREPLAVRIRRLIDAAFHAYPTVQELAQTLGVNRSSLYRAFQQRYGLSVKDYLLRRRLQRACALLLGSEATLDQVAAGCGWTDRQYFIRSFRDATGLTPGEWRRRRTGKPDPAPPEPAATATGESAEDHRGARRSV